MHLYRLIYSNAASFITAQDMPEAIAKWRATRHPDTGRPLTDADPDMVERIADKVIGLPKQTAAILDPVIFSQAKPATNEDVAALGLLPPTGRSEAEKAHRFSSI